jgi:aryl-alcohol dehydrogenase-like predicted oxidoreductase
VKLALGTAQFGQPYGIASPQPQIEYEECRKIIEYSYSQGMSLLDTAMGYGESESRLGDISISQWRIVTKLPKIPFGEEVSHWVNGSLRSSLEKLKVKSLYALLLHHPADLLSSKGPEIYATLKSLKAEGLIEKIGLSIYQPSELDDFFSIGEFDLVQSPLSILDRRLITSGWLNRLSEHGVEVHARSVFLQGLLLLSAEERHRKFNRWSQLWDSYHKWVRSFGLTPLQACVAYVSAIPQVQHVIVGVNKLDHIKEILKAQTCTPPIWSSDLSVDDEELLNPLSWLKLL